MATRRKPKSPTTLKDVANGSIPRLPSPSSMRHPSEASPYLPTKLETLLLLTYPATLVLGSVFSTLAPHIKTAASTYSPIHQSYYPPSGAPSYFAQKRNIFNTYFVKKGWFWTTVSLFLFIFTHPTLGAPLRPTLTARRLQATLRWALATLLWVFVTQWFFGPALIDRSFRLTGGACRVLADEEKRAQMSDAKEYFTAQACKLNGGRWAGGHDISGHVFLLILGSALLWMEILPAVLKAKGLREERRVRVGSGKVVKTRSIVEENARTEDGGLTTSSEEEEYTKLGVKVAVGIVALMWWMLLMTAAFFHTWFEKFTGFLVAFGGVFLIYFLPRGISELRLVVGMPGL